MRSTAEEAGMEVRGGQGTGGLGALVGHQQTIRKGVGATMCQNPVNMAPHHQEYDSGV